jgi:signal transduction histidine kinase
MVQPANRREITERWFNRLIVGGIVLGFTAVLLVSIVALFTLRQNQRHAYWVNHTLQAERQISQFRALLERSEAGRRGILLTDDRYIRVHFDQAMAGVRPAFDEIARITADDASQRAVIRASRPLLARELALLHQTGALLDAGRHDAAVAAFRNTASIDLIHGLRTAADRMLATEAGLLVARNAAQKTSLDLFFASLAALGVLLAGMAVASVWIILRYTRDLHASRSALRALNEDLEGAVQVRTTDLRRANDEIQRFAYIVSHDLRSPLVNVMGFTAELEAATREINKLIERVETDAPALVTADARLAAREDLPEAIGFIRTSTAKMDRLINAILRLSREGRRPITPEPIDMDALAQGVADTLKHRSDELGATVTLARPLPAITSDRLAVEQVLSNIVENALKYLQPGRPGVIALSGTVGAGRAIFTVADNGRGIDPRDHDRIFDLFRRSGVQDQPGEGIGLAHTRALAYRLGGTISVESALGQGASFHVNLPLVFLGEAGSPS